MIPNWLDWAQRLQALAQTGLTFAESPFDIQRYEEIRAIATEMMAAGADQNSADITSAFMEQQGYATPKIDVRGAVFRDGRILLVSERFDEGRWTLPGGWADVGEPPSTATVREIWEEAGYRAKAVKLLAFYDRNKHEHPAYIFHAYKAFFLCELTEPEQIMQPDMETLDTGWFALDELPELSTARVTEKQIRRFFDHLQHPEWPTDFD